MYSAVGEMGSPGEPKLTANLPPESEAYQRPDYTCGNAFCIAGSCCRECSVCAGPNCFPALQLRRLVSTNKVRFEAEGFKLDLIYLTPRLLVHGFPAVGPEVMWRNPRSEMLRFFDTRHSDHYRIYNFACEPGRVYPRHEFHGRTRLFPFLDHNAPTLAMIADFCDDAMSFLEAHPDNVVGVHCKAGKGRSGLMACCLLQRMGIATTAAEALDYYDARRVKGEKRGLTVPTQRRYVRYYERLLACGIRNSSQLVTPTRQLRRIVLTGYPGESEPGQELVVTVHAGVRKEHVLFEGRCVTPTAVFECDVELQGNTFLCIKSPKGLVADCWFDVWFVGRTPGQERLPTDTPAAYAHEVTMRTGAPPPGFETEEGKTEDGSASEGKRSEGSWEDLSDAKAAAVEAAEATPLAAALGRNDSTTSDDQLELALSGAPEVDLSPASPVPGERAFGFDGAAEAMEDASTLESPANMLVLSKGDLDLYRKFKPDPSKPMLVLHFDPLPPAAPAAGSGGMEGGPGVRVPAEAAAADGVGAAEEEEEDWVATPTAI